MIRVCHDLDFWMQVTTHPQVRAVVGDMTREGLTYLLGRANLTAFASDHGGFWISSIDSFGRVVELHTLFTPEGWGREVHGAAKALFSHVFTCGCDMIVTAQMRDNPHSQPPKSFGFRRVGEYAVSPHGEARTWMLTRDAWFLSPAWRSACRSLHS